MLHSWWFIDFLWPNLSICLQPIPPLCGHACSLTLFTQIPYVRTIQWSVILTWSVHVWGELVNYTRHSGVLFVLCFYVFVLLQYWVWASSPTTNIHVASEPYTCTCMCISRHMYRYTIWTRKYINIKDREVLGSWKTWPGPGEIWIHTTMYNLNSANL